jgi:uncharacterized protein (UPF0212 family)
MLTTILLLSSLLMAAVALVVLFLRLRKLNSEYLALSQEHASLIAITLAAEAADYRKTLAMIEAVNAKPVQEVITRSAA